MESVGSPAISRVYTSSITATWTTASGAMGYDVDASTANDFTGTLFSTVTLNTAATTLTDVALFVPALLIAFVLRFVSGWVLALAAFWTTRVSAVNNLFFTVQIFLSGQMVPLSVLPDWLQVVTWLLPFRFSSGGMVAANSTSL